MSLSSPSATLQAANVSWRGHLHAHVPLMFMSGTPIFAAAARGMLLDCMTLVTNGTFISGSCRTLAIQEMILLRLLPPRRHIEMPRSLCVKEASLLVLELWLVAQTSGLAHIQWSLKLPYR